MKDDLNELLAFYSHVQPLLVPFYANLSEMHNLHHINVVLLYALNIAHIEQIPEKYLKSIIFACAFHDCARINDEDDPEHGERALPIIDKFFALYTHFDVTEEEIDLIKDAVKNHTSTMPGTTDNPVLKVLADADRIRISQDYGYDEKYFNYEYSKTLAKS